MKTTEQYFPEVLFIMLHKVLLLLSLWMKTLSVTIQRKATPVVLFITTFILINNNIVFHCFLDMNFSSLVSGTLRNK